MTVEQAKEMAKLHKDTKLQVILMRAVNEMKSGVNYVIIGQYDTATINLDRPIDGYSLEQPNYLIVNDPVGEQKVKVYK